MLSAATPFKKLCIMGAKCKGLVSKIYKIYMTTNYLTGWEHILNGVNTMKEWGSIWETAHKIFSSFIVYKANLFKILYHWYHSSALLYSINPNISDQNWEMSSTIRDFVPYFGLASRYPRSGKALNISFISFHKSESHLTLPPPSVSRKLL